MAASVPNSGLSTWGIMFSIICVTVGVQHAEVICPTQGDRALPIDLCCHWLHRKHRTPTEPCYLKQARPHHPRTERHPILEYRDRARERQARHSRRQHSSLLPTAGFGRGAACSILILCQDPVTLRPWVGVRVCFRSLLSGGRGRFGYHTSGSGLGVLPGT